MNANIGFFCALILSFLLLIYGIPWMQNHFIKNDNSSIIVQKKSIEESAVQQNTEVEDLQNQISSLKTQLDQKPIVDSYRNCLDIEEDKYINLWNSYCMKEGLSSSCTLSGGESFYLNGEYEKNKDRCAAVYSH